MEVNNNISEVERFYYPMDTSINKETKEDLLRMWAVLKILPTAIHDKMLDPETARRIKNICTYFQLNPKQSSLIARIIRYHYFNKISLEDFPQILAREIPTDLRTAQEISQQLIQKIINDDSQEKAYQAQLINTSLTDALKGYPEIFEQPVTSVPIRSSNFSEPVRPSIKNWLADYTYNLGYESHDTITRGNYMFQSPNTKTLSFEDRQKLSYILKSYDEKTPVTVNVSTKQIIFPQAELTQKSVSGSIPNSQFPIPNKTPISNSQTIKQEPPSASPRISQSVYNLQSNNINQPQKALEQNYDHYQIPQRKPDFPSINQSSRMGSSEFKPQENPLPSSQNLTFSSPQKLPFERETEKKYSPPPVAPAPKPTPPPIPPKPVMDMPPVSSKPVYDIPAAPPKPTQPTFGPQPLRISPATMLDENHNEETREELPKNVVNLRE